MVDVQVKACNLWLFSLDLPSMVSQIHTLCKARPDESQRLDYATLLGTTIMETFALTQNRMVDPRFLQGN